MSFKHFDCIFCRTRLTWFAHLYKACFKQYHRELSKPLSIFIPDRGVVFDVGAHAGQFAKLFAHLAPNGEIYSIEPSEYALSILKLALKINQLSQVTVINTGLSDFNGEATLNIPIKESGSVGFGLSHIEKSSVPKKEKTVQQTIRVATLDSVVSKLELDRLDFIKSDIEGWELRMLVGASKTLRTLRPVVFTEVNNKSLARADDTIKDLFAYMEEQDYRPFLHTSDGMFKSIKVVDNVDIFFIPLEKVSNLVKS